MTKDQVTQVKIRENTISTFVYTGLGLGLAKPKIMNRVHSRGQ